MKGTCIDSTLNALEWEAVVRRLCQNVHFNENKKIISSHLLLNNNAEIEKSLSQIRYFSEHSDKATDIHKIITAVKIKPNEKEFFEFISILEKIPLTDYQILNSVALFLEIFKESLQKELPSTLFDTIGNDQGLRPFRAYLKELRTFIDSDGNVNERNHPLLAKIIEKIEALESTIQFVVNDAIKRMMDRGVLQYTQSEIFDGILVIPIRSDRYSSNIGNIIDRSNSGSTLYVEPFECKEIRIGLERHREELKHKRVQVIRELVELLSPHAGLVKRVVETTIVAERQISLSLYFSQFNYCCPTITQNETHLHNFFHPLIENAIPNSIDIKKQDSAIIISGPNAGGKTVIMKAIALSYLFIQKGFFVSASKATLPLMDSIHFYTNDRQDILSGLSSFTAECSDYIQLLKNSQGPGVICIDEIFSSTSNEEGSALAYGVIKELIQKNFTVLITTHHDYLRRFTSITEGMIPASMVFNEVTNRPTFKIKTESYGRSMAIPTFNYIQEKYDLKSRILDNAKYFQETHCHLGKIESEYRRLITELDIERHTFEQDRLALIDKNKRSESVLIQRYNSELLAIKNSYQKSLDELRNELLKIESSIKPSKTIRMVSDKIDRAEILDSTTNNQPFSNEPLSPISSLIIGKSYYSSLLNKTVVLLSVNEEKDSAVVTVNGKKVVIPITTLFANKESKKPVVIRYSLPESTLKESYDLRGMRLEEAMNLVEKILSDLLMGANPYVRIIHGHGIIKEKIREMVRSSSLYNFQTDPNNDGTTTLTLA